MGDWAKAEDRPAIIARCQTLQAEMLAGNRKIAPPGNIAWLCDQFQSHEESPYRKKRADTQRFYDQNVKIVRKTVGARRIDGVTGIDVRRWHREWSRDGAAPRRGKACVQALRRVAKFGCELRHKPSIELDAILHVMRFEGAPRRTGAMTRAQNLAARRIAREAGRPSLARALALQFGTMLRQKDVIGEWVRNADTVRWQMGLVWGEHLSRSLMLKKPTSKSNGKVVVQHDLMLMPDVAAEFDDVPVERRVGPVILDEATDRPYLPRHFRDLCRQVFRASGIPDDVWNMDARAGAITEALDAGATISDTAKSAGHTQPSTTAGYHRSNIEQTARVAKLRVAREES